MPAFRDLTGQVFGRLTALRRVGKTKRGASTWLCRCSHDGNEIETTVDSLTRGRTMSCGCLHREISSALFFKHGHGNPGHQSRTYISWSSVIQRCTNSHHKNWKLYGGANPPVVVCDRWLNSFEAFLEDMGERPAGTSLGRFGDTGNYEKSNCAWQTWKEQGVEKRKKNQLRVLAVLAA
jgi:hypothetical protein